MDQRLAMFVHTAFGLAFDVEKAPDRKSGFKPAQTDLGSGKQLFGDLRLDGFAALLQTGFAQHLVVLGGYEGGYKGELPVINRAWSIREMLVHDLGIDPNLVLSIPSASNTGGNIAAIGAKMEADTISPTDCALVSNLYHLPRAFLDLMAGNLPIPIYAVEAFWLLEDESRKAKLIERFGGGSLAERMAEEVQGIAHKLRGTYKPRTDVKPS